MHFENHVVLGDLKCSALCYHSSRGWEVCPSIYSSPAEVPGGGEVDKISPCSETRAGCPFAHWSRWLCTSSLGQSMPWFPARITELETCLSTEMLTFDGRELSFCLLHLSFLMLCPWNEASEWLVVEAYGLVVAWTLQAVGLLLFFLVNSSICKMTVTMYPGCLHDNVK